MAVGNLETILEDLGKKLGVPFLKPDSSGTCTIALPIGVSIRMAMNAEQTEVQLSIMLPEVSPGTYREQLLEAALKDNATPNRNFGAFSCTVDGDRLMLWKVMPATSPGAEIAEILQILIPKAVVWMEAIKNNNIPESGGEPPTPEEAGGLFGLKL